MNKLTLNGNTIYATTQIYSLTGFHYFSNSIGMFIASLYSDEYQLPNSSNRLNIINKTIYGKLLSDDGNVEIVAKNNYDNAIFNSYNTYSVNIAEIDTSVAIDILQIVKKASVELKKAECILSVDLASVSKTKRDSLNNILSEIAINILKSKVTINQPYGSLTGIPIEPFTLTYNKNNIGNLTFSILEDK